MTEHWDRVKDLQREYEEALRSGSPADIARLNNVLADAESAAVAEDERLRAERRERESHRAMITLGMDDLYQILNLPADVHFRGVYWNERRMCFDIHLQGERFERVPDECEAPMILSTKEWNSETNQLTIKFDLEDTK